MPNTADGVAAQLVTEVWRAFVGFVATMAAWSVSRLSGRFSTLEKRLTELELKHAECHATVRAMGEEIDRIEEHLRHIDDRLLSKGGRGV